MPFSVASSRAAPSSSIQCRPVTSLAARGSTIATSCCPATAARLRRQSSVVTIGGERHLLGPAPVLSRLSCFIAMSSYGGDALIAFLCTQLDQHGHRVRGAKRPVCAVFDISGYMRCCGTCDAHMLITSIYLTNIQLASLASLVWPCCASSHRMQPYTPTVLTGSGVTVLVASISVTLVTCGLGGVASGATAG